MRGERQSPRSSFYLTADYICGCLWKTGFRHTRLGMLSFCSLLKTYEPTVSQWKENKLKLKSSISSTSDHDITEITPIQKKDKCSWLLHFQLAVRVAAEFTLLLSQATWFCCDSVEFPHKGPGIKPKIEGDLPSFEGIQSHFVTGAFRACCQLSSYSSNWFAGSGPVRPKRHSLLSEGRRLRDRELLDNR